MKNYTGDAYHKKLATGIRKGMLLYKEMNDYDSVRELIDNMPHIPTSIVAAFGTPTEKSAVDEFLFPLVDRYNAVRGWMRELHYNPRIKNKPGQYSLRDTRVYAATRKEARHLRAWDKLTRYHTIQRDLDSIYDNLCRDYLLGLLED